MAQDGQTIGWVGAGRMGFELVSRLLRSGCQVAVWNRTRAKSEPLAELGATMSIPRPNSPISTSS